MMPGIFENRISAMMKKRPWLMGVMAACGLSFLAMFWARNHWITKPPLFTRIAAALADLPAAEGDKVDDFYQPNLCGPASLYVLCRLHGIETSIAELVELAGTDRRGTSVYGMVQAAQTKGLKAQAYESNLEYLHGIKGPVIIDFPAGHFCVLHSWQNSEAFLIDPPNPNRLVPESDLEAFWGKHIIIVE